MEQGQNEAVISLEEYKKLIAKTFNCPTKNIKFSKLFLDLEQQYIDVYRQIQYLGALYNLRDIKTRRVIFKSELDYGLTDRGDNDGQNFVSINFGDRSFLAFMDQDLCVVRRKEAFKYTVTHEFAHVLTSSARNANEAISAKYWKEIEPIWQRYCQDVAIWKQYRSDARCDVTDLKPFSMYSCKNIDEFHAEAFTSYHLSDCQSDIVKQVGPIIDKYFKKSRGKERVQEHQRLQTKINMKSERLR